MNMGRTPVALVEYTDKKWETRPMANLTKYQCELLAIALSGEARIRVLDRLYELEQKSNNHSLTTLDFDYSEDIPLDFTAKDIGKLGVKFYQAMSRIAEKVKEQENYIEHLEKGKQLLAEQHEIINTLTEENQRLTKENYELKDDPASMLMQSLKLATGREVQLSLWPTTHANDNTHSTIKGFCAEHKIKLAHGDSIRFANIIKKLCKEAGEKIPKIPDKQYGTLNIYSRYLLASAVKFL